MTGPLAVIAHEATRTGSPRVLLELLRYAAPRIDAPLTMTLLAGGGLAPDLRALAADVDPALTPAAVLINGSMAAGELARVADGVPVAVYVHEEGDALDVLNPTAKGLLGTRADLVLCVSDNSRRDLVDMGVPPERIELLRPVIVERPTPGAAEVAEARAELVGPDVSQIVIGCGDAGWRKGADLFVDVARRLADRPDVGFAWVGGGPRAFGRVLKYDAQWLGLAGRLRWIGEVGDVDPFLAAADVLVFPSREDPQPLVPFEAALMGTPTVCFAVGGLTALGAAGAVAAVAYPDTVQLAGAARDLLDSAPMSADLARRAVAWAREEQSVAVLGERFVALLTTLMAGAGARS